MPARAWVPLTAEQLADVVIWQWMHRLQRVGLTRAAVLSAVTESVSRADAAVAAGLVRFPKTYRWRAAENRLANIVRDERRRRRRQRDGGRVLHESVRQGAARRRDGVWKQTWSAWRRARTPEERYAVKEVIEQMLNREQFAVFVLHVIDGHSLSDVARLIRRRKKDVLELWEECRAAFREAA